MRVHTTAKYEIKLALVTNLAWGSSQVLRWHIHQPVEVSNPTEIEIVQRGKQGKNKKIQQINVGVGGNSCKPTVSIYKKEIL